jgi:transposase
MAYPDCSDCGTTLVLTVSPLDSAGWYLRRRKLGLPKVLLRCPRCGAAWEADLDGVLTRSAHRAAR